MSRSPASPERRADARRNTDAIFEAAIELLADRPGASMAEVAAAAGVTRQTVYAHFASREALLSAVAERALEQAVAAIDSSQPERGDPARALGRLVAAWWGTVSRYARVLEALAGGPPAVRELHDFHGPILDRLQALVERGQRSGDFDAEAPSRWLAVAFLGLMHAAAEEVAAGRMPDAEAERALARSVPLLFGAGA